MTLSQSEPENLCRLFVDQALKRGGHDNTTVISVFLTDMARPREGLIKKIGILFADIAIGVQKIIKKFKP